MAAPARSSWRRVLFLIDRTRHRLIVRVDGAALFSLAAGLLLLLTELITRRRAAC